MELTLDPIEARVLGCLAEKELTTPEYYPLSLNALTNACNQKSNRSPVMDLEETQVQEALDRLRKKQLAMLSSEGVRTARFAHNLKGLLHLEADEQAIFTELLLRGAQTLGELRTRGERMHPFDSLEAVGTVLQELAERTPPLVKQLPRQPGHKESRYTELLSLAAEASHADPSDAIPLNTENAPGLADEVAQLRRELQQLRDEFETFRQQFV